MICFILRASSSRSEIPPPPIPTLLEHCVNFLKMLAIPTKVMALHIAKVINNQTLMIIARCSPFASPIGLGNPLVYIPNGAELQKKHPKMAETFNKSTTLTLGLRIPRKEELMSSFSLLGIPDEGEFSEAWDVIGTLQCPSSIKPPSFAKDIAKTSEVSPKKSTANPSGGIPKDSRKRARVF